MKQFNRKPVFVSLVLWIILLYETLVVHGQNGVSGPETLEASSYDFEVYEEEDAVPPGPVKNPVVLVDVDSACENETDSLVEFLEAISDAGLQAKVQGDKTETLTIKNIAQLICSMTSYSTDVLETNMFEVIEMALPDIHIHVVTNRHKSGGSFNSSLISKEVVKYDIVVDVWVIDECTKTGHRHKRQTSSNIYQQLASQSGGLVINTSKGNIASVANLLKQTTKANTVDIMRFTFDQPMMGSFQVPVDDTMTQLTVLLTAQSSAPVVMAMLPIGVPVPFTTGSGHSMQNLGSNIILMDLNITKPSDYGFWKFQKIDSTTWDVKVTAQSNVGFTYQFLQPGPGGRAEFPIKGRPIAGEAYKLSVTVPQCANIKSITTALFLNEKNVPVQVFHLKNVGGRRGKCIFYEQINMISDSFHLAIEGNDKSSKAFRRFEPILIQPISVKLSVPSFSGVKLYKNETIDIPFTVTNAGSKQQDIDVKIEDDKHFAQDPKIVSFQIPAGNNKTGKFKIKGGLVIGETTTITITAKPYVKGQNIPGQFEIRRFTVEERPKNKSIMCVTDSEKSWFAKLVTTTTQDKINPTCNVTSVIGTCNIGSDLCACVNHTWSMDVAVGDEGFGLREIFPIGAGSNQSFTHDNFTIGHTISQGIIYAHISADCCHQMATIEVVDDAGNIASCSPNISQNFKPPDPSHCNNTHMNITIPCNRTAITGTCGNFPANPCDCHNSGYHIEVEFGSVGWDVYNAFTRHAGNNASLQRNGNIVELDSDCCYQQIMILVEDLAGNIGQCNVSIGSFNTPKLGDCTTTTTSTTTTSTPTTTTKNTKSTVTSSGSSTNMSGFSSIKSGSSASTSSTKSSSPSAANSKTSEEKSSNGDHLTTGAVAGAMAGAGVVALTSLVVMAVVVWKALSKSKTVEPVSYNRRRDNSWT